MNVWRIRVARMQCAPIHRAHSPAVAVQILPAIRTKDAPTSMSVWRWSKRVRRVRYAKTLSQATIVGVRKALQPNRIRKLRANKSTSIFCARAISIARTTPSVSKANASARTVSSRKDRFVWTLMSVERMPDFAANDLLASTHRDRIDVNAQRKFSWDFQLSTNAI